MYKLVISDDEGKTTTVPLVRDEITIGRKEGNTIRLTDRNVSRRHAKLQKQNGGYVLQDLGSYNGTVINGTRLSDQRALKMGDQIVIGDYKLNIVEESTTQVAPAAAPVASAASVAETYEAPAQSGGHHPQATVPAIPTALGVPPPATTPVPEHLKRLQLVFLAPAGTPGPFAITKLPILLGRSEIADVSLPFSSISREHAKIVLENDQLVIEDLGSSNGVVVNGERVKKHPIKPGDAITMGVVECKLGRVGEAVAATQLAPMASAAISMEPEVAAPAKKSSVGTLVGVGVLVAVLGGGGAVIAMRGNTPTQASIGANTTVVTGSEPATSANNGSAANTQNGSAAATANLQQPAQAPQGNGAAEPSGAGTNAAANTQRETNFAANTQNQAVLQNAPQTEPSQNAQPSGHGDPSARRGTEPSVRRVRNASAGDPSSTPATQSATQGTTTTARTTTTATSGASGSNTQSAGSSAASASGGTQNVAACLLANDFQCVVGALRNRAGTEVEFNQLVTAYRGLHNQAAAEQTMRRYLARFPDGRYAERYRDMLGQ
jgi:pSer/pThr/pTyr-binding forkhead associated (FHA) protein